MTGLLESDRSDFRVMKVSVVLPLLCRYHDIDVHRVINILSSFSSLNNDVF